MKRPNKATYCSNEIFTFLSPSSLDPGQREKINLNFYFIFALLCGVSGFMKAPQRSVKIEIQVNFYFM